MKKFLPVFSVVLAIVTILSLGLGSTQPKAAAQDQVTITWWHIGTVEDQGAYWQSLADAYMEANPNVTIEITILENEAFKERLVTVMQAGDPPDIFQSWGGGVLWQFAEAGLVRNIAPELEGEWKDSFSAQAALELYGQDGEYYGVPWTWGAVGMFYNKALFAEAGLDPEAPPATWEEFLAAVQALKDAGITPISLGEGDKWPGHFWWVYLAIRLGGEQAFLDAYNRDGAFTDEPFVQAGEYLQQLIDLEPFPEGYIGLGYGDQAGLMGDGKAAMELMGQWAPSVQIDNSENGGEAIQGNLGWFPFPVVEGGAGNPGDVLGGGDGYAVGSNAEDEAVDFLRFITSAENQAAGAKIWILPTVAAAESAIEDPILQTILAARNSAPYSQLYYDQFLPPAVGQAVNDAVQGLFEGTLSPEDVASAIEDEASFELDE
ncbi:MAG: ABC transporter substrate-binding protein [Chloroflexota bacterium]|nr:extracellular solute-binding protein [Chloroflexota bacterium]NOG64014.1 extracellular solute-binding protein [Chloroflexota bacterium]GIK65683.1 MAG: ABC transporter substrate-binding protein [Chloroflexota bacterium]